ncbi:TonB-dependent receptor [Hymenobacter sp. BT175]|uniref:TonB-dependent receptor n=1 Tax=Hymenobacter translucens TaxID=2886507 RepID=UPI001D0ED49E|nr:TonB-dependent receptor [Hymenobacter translucens]MCC2548900.1 TonB-dependent receptor [Hymenobacter translucens]
MHNFTSRPFGLLIGMLLCLGAIEASGQAFLRGKVVDRHSGEVLVGATVAVPAQKAGTATDASGSFVLPVADPGKLTLQVRYLGYATLDTTLAVGAEPLLLRIRRTENRTQEVVVTGVSRATEIRRSPIPVAVLSSREISQTMQTNLVDALVRKVPGLSGVTTGPNITKPFIRGLGYNRVLTLYDGVRQEGQQWGDEHGIEIDQNGIERAEVVKGPASLTYGSDALAGVVNLIPMLPAETNGKVRGSFSTDYQTNNRSIGTSAYAYGRAAHFYYSLRLSHKQAADYQNRLDGRVFNTGFRDQNATLLTGWTHRRGDSRLNLTVYDNRQEIPDGSRDSLTRRFTRQILENETDADIRTRPLVSRRDLNSYRIDALHQHIQHYRAYTTHSLQLGAGTLNAQLGLQQNRRREYNHPTLPRQPGLSVQLTTLTYDLRYSRDVWGLETSYGLNGMYQRNENRDATDFPIPDYRLFDAGGFVFLKKSLGRLDLSGGLRYDQRQLRYDALWLRTDPATGFDRQVTAADTAGARLQINGNRRLLHGLSGSVGGALNLSESWTVKANLARGYRSPNITELASNGLDPGAHIVYLGRPDFAPEFNLQQDLGVFFQSPVVDFSVEVFHNAISNFIYLRRLSDADGNEVIIVPGNRTYQYTQSNARLYGGEARVRLTPPGLPWLTWTNDLAWIRGVNLGRQDEPVPADARNLSLIPPLQVRSEISAEARRGFGRLARPYARLEVAGFGRQTRFLAADDTETATPGYFLLNASVGTALTNRRGKTILQVGLSGNNLLDKVYQSHLNRLKYFEPYQRQPGQRSGIYDIGRNIGIKLSLPLGE